MREIQSFRGEKTWIETTLKATRRREDNIKINVKLEGLAWNGFI